MSPTANQKVKELMTTSPVTIPPTAFAWDAARLMKEQDIGDVIVVDGDRLCGIVTDRDLVVRVIGEGRDPSRTTIGEISSENVKTVSPDDDADEAVRLMREQALRRLPVTENGKPVGVVSIGDLAVERDPDSALADISAAAPNQ
ncbi:MAG: CBS domain-containing protein [Acidimicrobiia bacterium]